MLEECKSRNLPVRVARATCESCSNNCACQTTGEEKKRPMVTESKRQMLKEMAEKSADDLSRNQKEQFSQLVLEYADIFTKDGELGWTNKMKHLINTGDAQRIHQSVRRLPLCQRQMQKLLTCSQRM